MNEKRKRMFHQGLCPYGAGAPTPGFIALEANPDEGERKRKGKAARKGRPIRLGPATALGSRPRVALSSGRENAFYTEGSETQELSLTRNTPPATLG